MINAIVDAIVRDGWIVCPHCNKRHFPAQYEAIILNMHLQCKACKKKFAVNVIQGRAAQKGGTAHGEIQKETSSN